MGISKPVFLIGLFLAGILAGCVPESGDIEFNEINQWRQFTSNNGLVDDQILSLYEDTQGNIWIGTSNGLSIYNGSSFSNYTMANGLNSNYINDFVEDKDGDVWIASSNGINYMQGGTINNFFSGVYVYALIELNSQDILLGTDGFGAVRYSFADDDFYFFNYQSGCDPCNIALSLFQDSNTNVWVGTENGIYRVSGSNITSYTTAQGLSGNSVTSIEEDLWGSIWVGTFDGQTISRISQGTINKINLSNSNTQNWVWDLETDNIGTLYIATAIDGLYFYDGAMVRRDFDNLPDKYISALLRDSKGNIWIGTLFDGLIKFTPNL